MGSKYGALAGFTAGIVAGRAAAGGTSAVFYRAAGYNVNIGLAIGTEALRFKAAIVRNQNIGK